MDPVPSRRARLFVLVMLWLTGVYMRAPVLIAAPLGQPIGAALGLDQASLGTLTTLPVLMLGLGAPPAVWLIGRFGARATLITAFAVTALASAARGAAPDLALLWLATAGMGLGIAAMQPALPALVPRWCPGFMALGSTVYLNGAMLGEFIGAGLALPVLLPLAGGDWQRALWLFSLPAVLILPLLLRPRLYGQRVAKRPARWPDWRDPTAWRFGVLLGVTGASFFGMNAYMGGLMQAAGLARHLDIMLLVFNLSQVAASILMISAARSLLRAPHLFGFAVALQLLALGGFAVASTLGPMIAAAIVLGFASALQLIALVTLPPQIRTPEAAGTLAAGMFCIGYITAFVLPLIAGLAADAFSPIAVVWMFLACNLMVLPLAWRTPTLGQIDG